MKPPAAPKQWWNVALLAVDHNDNVHRIKDRFYTHSPEAAFMWTVLRAEKRLQQEQGHTREGFLRWEEKNVVIVSGNEPARQEEIL